MIVEAMAPESFWSQSGLNHILTQILGSVSND